MSDLETLQSDALIDAEFVEYEFADFDKATAAERFFPSSLAHTGTSITIRPSHISGMEGRIESDLAAAGLSYRINASSLTEEDMWPSDEDDDTPRP